MLPKGLLVAIAMAGLAAPPVKAELQRSSSPEATTCRPPIDAIEANNKLGFAAFDQSNATPYTPWWLGDRRCFAEAAEVYQLYLLFGPSLSEREKNVVTWHMGQYLAYAGREAEAAAIVASTRRPAAEPEPDQFDWNTYVVGTWAFLVKDRSRLEAARTKLSNAPGQRNAINATALGRLVKCFDRSYEVAIHDGSCAPQPAR